MKKYKYIFLLYILLIAVLAIYLREKSAYLSVLIVAINIILSIDWAIKCFGFKRAMLFALLSFAFTMALENISFNTGYPYGTFKYNIPGPKLGSIPAVIGFLYFPMIIIGWIFGDITTSALPVKKSAAPLVRSILAIFVIVSINILFEPIFSIVLKLWEYPNGGGVFGVPLSNTIGWIINGVISLAALELICLKKWKREQIRISRLYAASIYLLIAQLIPIYVCRIILKNKIIADTTGKGWNLLDIYDSLILFGTVIMGILFVTGTICFETYIKKITKRTYYKS